MNKNCEPLSKAGESQKDLSLQSSKEWVRVRPYLISHVSHRIVRVNGWCLSQQVTVLWCDSTSWVVEKISFRDDTQNVSTQHGEDQALTNQHGHKLETVHGAVQHRENTQELTSTEQHEDTKTKKMYIFSIFKDYWYGKSFLTQQQQQQKRKLKGETRIHNFYIPYGLNFQEDEMKTHA